MGNSIALAGVEQIFDRGQRLIDLGCVRTGIERAVQVRVQLALLAENGTGGHDAQLASLQVETGA